MCFPDADDVVLPHRFERAAHILVSRPEVDGVYEATRIAVESGQADAGLGGGADGDTFGLASALEGIDLLRHLLRGFPWHLDAFLCRRSMFARTGIFDERLRIAEDCHLWCVQLFMYATPVIYPLSALPPEWRDWAALNPVAPVIEWFRDAYLGAGSFEPTLLLTAACVTTLILLAGVLLFNRVERTFIDTV